MEKTNRALIGVEDNAEAIRGLRARVEDSAQAISAIKLRLESAEGEGSKLKVAHEIGQYKVLSSKAHSVFGTYKINGPTVFIIATGDTSTHQLYFNNNMVLNSIGPLMCELESGEGELRLYPSASLPRAVIIGDATKTG